VQTLNYNLLILKIMKKLKYLNFSFPGLILLVLFVFSCDSDEFLENIDKSKLTDTTQWASVSNTDIYINDLYNEIPRQGAMTEQLDYFTDDYNISHYYTGYQWRNGICQVPPESWSHPWFGTHGPTNGYTWDSFFKRIRMANTGLQNMEKSKENFSSEWYNKRVDEIRFLRAYFYSEFFMHVGGLPIIKTPLDRTSTSEDELLTPRSTFEETFNFIVSELEEIISNGNLSIKYSYGDSDAGRATLGAALALKGGLNYLLQAHFIIVVQLI
jgi:hypothetical protein